MSPSIFLILLFPFLQGPLSSQVPTREAAIEAARDKKAAVLEPDEPTKAEQVLTRIKDDKVIERIQAGYNGIRGKLGGLATGGGFALGPEYAREDLAGGKLHLRTSAAISFRNFQRYDLELKAPETRTRPVFFQGYAVRHFYPSLQYYGQGPDSEKDGRSNFLYEDLAIDGTVGVAAGKGLRLAASGGYLKVHAGRGRDQRFASIEQNFGGGVTPGLDAQPDFARLGGYVELDRTDNRLGPRGGTYLLANFSHLMDRGRGQYSFDRLDLEGQQYIPFFNQRRVIALRGRTNLTYTRDGRQVPFYLQPVLGGSDDLRGFRPFRFYGDQSMVMNAEYRWEVFSGLDMALFFDAGKVARRRADLDFSNLETTAGIGWRWNARNSVFLRMDVGFSHEGFQVWLKFNNIFAPKLIHSSSSQIVQ
jgi:outer membrane protein assembly factor BamA